MKEGSIIFLTRRKAKPAYRIFISYMIALFTKRKGQSLINVKVHSAIIYSHKGVLKVRDMDKHGDEHYTFNEYKRLFGDRFEIIENPFDFSKERLIEFNYSCRSLNVKYDYSNTFVYQVLKRFTGFFIGKVTLYKRMCAEDAQRQFNILYPGYFKTPEATNPNELFEQIKKRFKL